MSNELSFDHCICDTPGFCPLFNKVMTDNPPNWQWCQNCSKKQRAEYLHLQNKKYSIDLDGKKTFVTNEMLINDSLNLIDKLPAIKAVLGCPRSGMMSASFISTMMSIPLLSISNNKIVKLSARSKNGGSRMAVYEEKDAKLPILVIDDTVFLGTQMNIIKKLINEEISNESFIFACIYCHPQSISSVDFFSKTLSYPHILEWNIFDAEPIMHAAIDIDGVLSPDVPLEFDDDGEKYINYITNVKPIKKNLPKLFNCKALCTARLEKYRNITEKWLKDNNVKYSNLYMFDGTKEERDINHDMIVGNFKANKAKKINARLFIESSDSQAKIIANTLQSIDYTIPVLSLNSKIIY